MTKAVAQIDDNALTTESLLGAARWLGLSNQQLCSTLGISKATLDRARAQKKPFSAPKVLEISLLVTRVYRAIFAILGGDAVQMRHWMATPNRHLLDQAPVDLFQRVDGLAMVVRYVDATRGRI